MSEAALPSSSLAVAVVESAAAWRAALANLPQAHALQSWEWGQFKARWGWSAFPLLFTRSDGAQTAAAAAMILRRSLPRLPWAIWYIPRGPVLDYADQPLRQAVLKRLERLAREQRALLVKIDPEVVLARGVEEPQASALGAAFVAELELRGWRFSQEQIQFRNTVLLPLAPAEDELLAAMKQKTRYNIRLAGRRDVSVRQGGLDDLAAIEELYRQTAQRDGFTVRPPAYYRDVWASLYKAGMAQPLLAEYEGRLLAAVIVVRHGPRAIYMYGASSDQERRRMPNHVLQWEAICWARRQGCEVYDFWGAPDEFVETDSMWGVWRFKAGFGGEVVRHIGAWDYTSRPFWYWLYARALPRYRDLLRARDEEA